ncbi:hypothetical protein V5F49_05055 [Xanthobacter sp. V3C-3]|uniref:hypothetical protein n=1 Tax=Xanthobacter lutulentifluminis TaxID=3119935 RepID=UPI00372AFEAB
MTTRPPETIAAALRQVRGKPAAEKPRPATMLAAIEAARAAQPAKRPPRKGASVVNGPDGIPGLRQYIAEFHNGKH